MLGVIFSGAMNGRSRAYDDTTDGKVTWEFNAAANDMKTVPGRIVRGSVMNGAGPTIAAEWSTSAPAIKVRSGTPVSVLMAFSVDGQ